MSAGGYEIYNSDEAEEFMWDIVYFAFYHAEENYHFLVVADLYLKHDSPQGDIFINKLIQVVKEELSGEIISEWKEDCREPRKQLLSDMLKQLEQRKAEMKEYNNHNEDFLIGKDKNTK